MPCVGASGIEVYPMYVGGSNLLVLGERTQKFKACWCPPLNVMPLLFWNVRAHAGERREGRPSLLWRGTLPGCSAYSGAAGLNMKDPERTRSTPLPR